MHKNHSQTLIVHPVYDTSGSWLKLDRSFPDLWHKKLKMYKSNWKKFGNLQIHIDKIGKFKDLWRKNLEFSKTEGIKLEISKSINEN